MRPQHAHFAGIVAALLLPLVGCLGWGDMFRAAHSLTADYYLMEGEGQSPDDLYLFLSGESSSIGGALNRIGWSKHFIVFTESNRPGPWKVIDVQQHKTSTITEAQRASDKRFSAIAILKADRAWANSGQR